MREMPTLITSRLAFSVITSIFDQLLDEPSDLKLDRLVLAALLSAEAEEGLRVEVSPADEVNLRTGAFPNISIWRGRIREEMFLIAPRVLLPTAMTEHCPYLLEQEDLPRIHILTQAEAGPTEAESGLAMAAASGGLACYQDVSILDIRHEIRSVTARLPRPLRGAALHMLDQYLRTRQDTDLVDKYVSSLFDTTPEIARQPYRQTASTCWVHDSMPPAD